MQPPNSPQDFPSYNDPLPPVPGGSPASGGYAPSPGVPGTPRGPIVSFDALGEAWGILTKNLGIWIAATLLMFVVVSIPSFVISFVIGMSSGIQPGRQPDFGPGYFLSQAISMALSWILGSFVLGGMFRMAIQNVRTGQADIGQMFSVADVYPRLLGCYFLIMLAVYIGAIFCVIPGLLAAGVFMFSFPLIVDKRLGAIEAMKASYAALSSQMWMALAYVLVLSIVSSLGLIACCVGILATYPLLFLGIAVVYRDFFPDAGVAVRMPGYPSAPIADPNS